MRLGIENGMNITPLDIDIGNLIPLINSYAFAAIYNQDDELNSKPIPIYNSFEKDFKEAGLYIYSNIKYFAIVNYKKGGTIKVYDKTSKTLDIEDGGIAGRLRSNKVFKFRDYGQFDWDAVKGEILLDCVDQGASNVFDMTSQ